MALALTLGLPVARADEPSVEQFRATARRAELRVLEGAHLTLATDRPARSGDGVDDLPAIFDQAFAAWCGHYGLEPERLGDWRAFGCLVVDRERFRAAGLLPADLPAFTNGFCLGHRFWLVDQSNPAYRRHLLLHEGVHAFTLTVRALAAPAWYTEGIAELLATHRLEAAADGGPRFVATPIPERPGDVEQLGRIEQLRRLRAARECPGLEQVFAARSTAHDDLSAYAANWAAVALLSRHPAHARRLAALERGPLDAALTERLAETDGWDPLRAARDFDAFTAEVDYGFDFARSAIDWSPGRPLAEPMTVQVDAARGWQRSGVTVQAGTRCHIAATGRCTIGALDDAASGTTTSLESEAAGISLRWYRGRPAGRLLAAQWVERPEDGDRPRFVVLAEGGDATLTAAVDGPIYLKVNEPPGELADNEGSLSVELTPR